MKLQTYLGIITLGILVSFLVKALSFPTQAFLVLDLVAGTNLNGSSVGVWQRVIGNPIYLTVVMGIGFVAEFLGAYRVTKLYLRRFNALLFLMAMSNIASNFIVDLDHPIWFNILMIIRVLTAYCLGAFYCIRQRNQTAPLQQDVPPIALP